MVGVRGAVVALCAMVLTGSSLVCAPATQAEGLIVCAGEEDTTYSPGLSPTPRPTKIHARSAYSCSGPLGRTVPVAGETEAQSPSASCLAFNSPTGRERLRLPDGRTSVVAYDQGTAARIGGVNVVQLTGWIVEGPGTGARVTRDVGLIPADPAGCLGANGVTQATGQGQLRIAL
ncbi:hypothetical protein ACFY1P_24150 [Streptomyces sp. NPDC001407]|uniref:hypothetical protein n=1 Tax=unclassified Streptomyces TaxID=2593676 RepID=UPI0033E89431